MIGSVLTEKGGEVGMRLIDADALIGYLHNCTFLDGDDRPIVYNVIQKQPTVSGWVSVKDRLPDAAGYECLVCAVNENYNQTHVFTAHTGYGEPGWWTGNVHYMARVQSPSDNRLHPALNVTHWMPLPEAPKEDEE